MNIIMALAISFCILLFSNQVKAKKITTIQKSKQKFKQEVINYKEATIYVLDNNNKLSKEQVGNDICLYLSKTCYDMMSNELYEILFANYVYFGKKCCVFQGIYASKDKKQTMYAWILNVLNAFDKSPKNILEALRDEKIIIKRKNDVKCLKIILDEILTFKCTKQELKEGIKKQITYSSTSLKQIMFMSIYLALNGYMLFNTIYATIGLLRGQIYSSIITFLLYVCYIYVTNSIFTFNYSNKLVAKMLTPIITFAVLMYSIQNLFKKTMKMFAKH